ncbi:MAG: hypothetical protein ACE5JA_05620 [bacterium]
MQSTVAESKQIASWPGLSKIPQVSTCPRIVEPLQPIPRRGSSWAWNEIWCHLHYYDTPDYAEDVYLSGSCAYVIDMDIGFRATQADCYDTRGSGYGIHAAEQPNLLGAIAPQAALLT